MIQLLSVWVCACVCTPFPIIPVLRVAHVCGFCGWFFFLLRRAVTYRAINSGKCISITVEKIKSQMRSQRLASTQVCKRSNNVGFEHDHRFQWRYEYTRCKRWQDNSNVAGKTQINAMHACQANRVAISMMLSLFMRWRWWDTVSSYSVCTWRCECIYMQSMQM